MAVTGSDLRSMYTTRSVEIINYQNTNFETDNRLKLLYFQPSEAQKFNISMDPNKTSNQ